MEYPDNLYYTEDHEWLRLDDDGKTATIGITDFAQSELGEIVFVEFEKVGTEVDSEGVLGTVEAVKTVSELFSPVAGRIVQHNDALDSDPELVNNDPYGDGWMIKIEVANAKDVQALLRADAYKALIGS